MKGVTVIERKHCKNFEELLKTLIRISSDALHQIPNAYVTVNDASVVVQLERQTLTDGSEVYNLSIEGVEVRSYGSRYDDIDTSGRGNDRYGS